jgi:hypothetical protein
MTVTTALSRDYPNFTRGFTKFVHQNIQDFTYRTRNRRTEVRKDEYTRQKILEVTNNINVLTGNNKVLGKPNRLRSFIGHGPPRKHIQQFFFCCVRIRCHGNVFNRAVA